jgi:hypothetical protein
LATFAIDFWRLFQLTIGNFWWQIGFPAANRFDSPQGFHHVRSPKPKTRNLKPETRNPKPETRNPKHDTCNPKHET